MLSVVCKLRGECQRVQNAIEKYDFLAFTSRNGTCVFNCSRSPKISG